MLQYVSEFHSFLRLNKFPLYVSTTYCLFTYHQWTLKFMSFLDRDHFPASFPIEMPSCGLGNALFSSVFGKSLRRVWASLVAQMGEKLPASARTTGDLGSIPGSGRCPGERREWLPNPVFWPGESHGQRRLAGYSPWDCKESDTTEQLTLSLLRRIYVSSFSVW